MDKDLAAILAFEEPVADTILDRNKPAESPAAAEPELLEEPERCLFCSTWDARMPHSENCPNNRHDSPSPPKESETR